MLLASGSVTSLNWDNRKESFDNQNLYLDFVVRAWKLSDIIYSDQVILRYVSVMLAAY